MGSLFGKPAKQESGNKNLETINSTFNPVAQYAGTGASALAALLGGDSSGFEGFKKATGFNSQLSRGLGEITGTGAARGMLRSGGTEKRLGNYIADTQNKYYNDYSSGLGNLAQLGLGAGGLLTQAGQYSKGKGPKKGLGDFAGSLATAAATGGIGG